MTPDDPRHGRSSGASQHRRDGEPVCDPCRLAANRSRKRYRYLAAVGKSPTIDATGLVRRVRALQTLGWTLPQIASDAGVAFVTLQKPLYRSTTCRPATFLAIASSYERLSMTFPPMETRQQRRDTSYARSIAKRHGWAPPLAWDNIDDPGETPTDRYAQRRRPQAPSGAFLPPVYEEPDEQVVFRILSGDWRLPCTVWEKRAVVAQWNGPHRELETLTGWKVERYTDREEQSA